MKSLLDTCITDYMQAYIQQSMQEVRWFFLNLYSHIRFAAIYSANFNRTLHRITPIMNNTIYLEYDNIFEFTHTLKIVVHQWSNVVKFFEFYANISLFTIVSPIDSCRRSTNFVWSLVSNNLHCWLNHLDNTSRILLFIQWWKWHYYECLLDCRYWRVCGQ